MKLINEKGRLFGIINPVDLVILLVILLAVGGIGWKVLGAAESKAETDLVNATVVVHIRGAMNEVVEGIEKADPVGQTLLSNNATTQAVIKSVAYTDYVAVGVNDDGQHVITTDPMRKDIFFTITAPVDRASNAPSIGVQEIRVGATFSVKTKYIHMNGTIESIVYDEIAAAQ
ncbi:MAG: DUF4330 domain-containing protein [Clostridia bacterium]|nr:DUF4330 domain-containing protein [Clostridia bacterium]